MKKLNDDLIIFRTCSSLPEAQIIKIQLEQEGLHPEIKDEHMQTIASHLSSLLGNITILLPEDEVNRANEILAQNQEHAAKLPEFEEEKSTDIHDSKYDQKATYAKRAAFFGILLVPVLPTLYSLTLSLQCILNWQYLQSKSRSSLLLTTVINILAVATIVFFFKSQF